MDIQEIGEVLKNERINQGLSCEDVYDKTKISPYVLQHIEEGILDDLPHPVYVKGFIKSYANFLGLDSEELAKEFARNMALDEEEENKNKINSSSSSGIKAKFILAIILLFVLIAGWFVFKSFYLDTFENSSQVGREFEKTTNASKTEVEHKTAAESRVSSDRGEEFNKTESIQAIMDNNNTGQDNSSVANTAKKEKKSHVMTVIAKEPCWLLAEMDSETRDVYLSSGEKLDLKFENSLTLKLGNAGGVKLVYDGENYPLEAELGEVKIISLP